MKIGFTGVHFKVFELLHSTTGEIDSVEAQLIPTNGTGRTPFSVRVPTEQLRAILSPTDFEHLIHKPITDNGNHIYVELSNEYYTKLQHGE